MMGLWPIPNVRWNTQNLGWKQPLPTAPMSEVIACAQVHKQASWEA